jgi:PAS domain S-box-containing protein
MIDEKYLQTLLASIGDAVISTDAAGRITLANPVAQALLRANEDQIIGKSFDEVFRLENQTTRAKVESPVAKVLRGDAVVGLANNTLLIAHDGTELLIEDNAAPIHDKSGKLEGVVLVFRDSTARHQLEASRRLLASIVQSSDDAIISKTLDGLVTSWNESAERIFGYSQREMIGKTISTIAVSARADEMPQILKRIRNGERIDHYETVRKAKDGRLINVSLTVSPLYDGEGRIVGASKIARDITEELRARTEIAVQREWLHVTMNSIGDAVITTDNVGNITYLNPAAEELTAWSSAEAAGKPLEDVFRIINEESRRNVENPTSKVLREGRTVGLANHTLLIARDGRERSIDDSAAPIRNSQGQILGVVLIFRDVTERRDTERQLRIQTTELRRTNDELSQFAYAISHDLREPLRNVHNFSELLVREYEQPSNSNAQAYAKYVLDGVSRMEMLLNDLLVYSQMGPAQEQARRETNTGEIVRKTLETLRATIYESQAEITSDHLPTVLGHEAQLSQLFQNLISNAIKYRSDSPPRIHVRAHKQNHEWVFSVRDNGIGIAPEYHKMIFGVFKRLQGKDIPGTGIGLAICSKVVELHGGRIWVESQSGEGSEFFFTIPESIPGEQHQPD